MDDLQETKKRAYQRVRHEALKDDLATVMDMRERYQALARESAEWSDCIAICNDMIQTIKRKLLREING